MTASGFRHVLGPDDPRHGTHNGYDHYGCRCDACRNANRLHAKRQRAMRKMYERTGRPRPRRARGRSEFPHPARPTYPTGTIVRHKETGRQALVLEDLGDHLLVRAEPTNPPLRPGSARPEQTLRWKRTNTRIVPT